MSKPNINQIQEILYACMDFININKRKVYGGYGLDLHLRYNQNYKEQD